MAPWIYFLLVYITIGPNSWCHGREIHENLSSVAYPGNNISIIEYAGEELPEHIVGGRDSNSSIGSVTVSPDVSKSTVNNNTQARQGLPIITINFPRVRQAIVASAWIFTAILAKIVFQVIPKLPSLIPESCFLILLGMAIGSILFHAGLDTARLDPNVFFIYMLPPIILDAGYSMPNRLFFDNLGTILLFAVIGTIWNCFSIGISLWGCGLSGIFSSDLPLLDALLFAALISAVDPVAVIAVFEEIHVDEVLYIIVFGEALLNDAVGVVLYNTFNAYGVIGAENIYYTDILAGLASFVAVATGGTSMGIVWGFLTGFVTRFTHRVGVVEPLFVFVMSYLAYLTAETFQMSGILAITFCGITMKNYVESNISSDSATTLKKGIKMMSNGSETVIFLILGVNTIHDEHVWNTPFILLLILFCTVFRVIGVAVLTKLANCYRLRKLDKVDTFMMSYGGLRGAIAFALVLSIDANRVGNQPLFVTATIAVIFFTVFLQGITVKPLVKLLKVRISHQRDKTMHERVTERVMDYALAGILGVLGHMGKINLRNRFKKIDAKYIRPCLVRNHNCREPKILETYSRITLNEAVGLAQRNPSFFNTGSHLTLPKIDISVDRPANVNGAQFCENLAFSGTVADEEALQIDADAGAIMFSARKD